MALLWDPLNSSWYPHKHVSISLHFRTDREMLWESAETYHRLHSVLTSCNSVGDVRGLALALTSLNLARHASVKPRVMAEIYLMLAIRLKLSWPKFSTMFQRYIYRQSTKHFIFWCNIPNFSVCMYSPLVKYGHIRGSTCGPKSRWGSPKTWMNWNWAINNLLAY